MGDRVECELHLHGAIARDRLPMLAAALEDGDPFWRDGETADYLARGGGVIVFPEMNYGEMPADLTAALTALGLAWAWRSGAGAGFPASVEFHDASGADASFIVSEYEILLTISEARDVERRAEAARWQAFWRETGALTITDSNTEGR